jgi:HEAT repeat protein
MWPIIANLKDTNDFASHVPKTNFGTAASNFTPVLWSKVSSDPWSQVPEIDLERLKADTGATSEDLKAVESEKPLVSVNHSGFLACEPEYMDFVALESAETKCFGYLATTSGPKFLLQSIPIPSLAPAAKPVDSPIQVSFKTADPRLPLGGYCTDKLVDDPDQGKALLVEDDWVVRNGWVQLYKNEATDTSKYHFLDLMVKPVAFNHSIVVVGKDGTKTYQLFGPENPAPEKPNETETTLGLPPDGTWHHVVIDLSGVGKLQAIYLTAGNARWWPVSLDQKAGILLGDYKLLTDGTPTPPAQQQAGDDPESKARFLAGITTANYEANKAQVLADLKGPDRLTELNAANVYTRVKDKAAFDPLGDLTKNLDPRIAEISMRALMSQGTDIARGPVLLALTNGPFDSNRFWAAKSLTGQKDPYLAENYSRLIASKSWETRLVATEALAAMPGDKPKEFLMAFLLDINPQIETTIAEQGDPSNDLFEKRMQWYAVNDPSDEMRFLSNVALLKSTLPDYPQEGIKGLHDDSWWVHRELLNYLAAHPDAKWHDNIVSALQDSNEEVKAAAISALSALGTSANLNSLANVRDDKDPRVQKALSEFSKGHAG